MKQLTIFDTTLRDGEQTPGTHLYLKEKLEIAEQLSLLNVDIIEAGFPASSEGDFNAVQTIAKHIKGRSIAGLARANIKDIDLLWDALRFSEDPRIHIVLGSSDIHLKHKFRKSRKDILEMAVQAVSHARRKCTNIEYSLEDASRSDIDYIRQVIRSVVQAGATTINLPDSVGYATPEQYGKLVRKIKEELDPNIALSVHCHNDLGLATANTLSAIINGADQVEVTVNGIGERAGNTALEEVVTAIHTHPKIYQVSSSIQMSEIYSSSQLVRRLMKVPVQPNKAIVGDHSFSHSSGIHQDGILKDRSTYEILSPKIIGAPDHQLVLTARSGRHAFKHQIQELGFGGTEIEFESMYQTFLKKADQGIIFNTLELKQLIQEAGVSFSVT